MPRPKKKMNTDLIQSVSYAASIPSSSSSCASATGAATVNHNKTWRKPADKPKHPLNAYNLFFQFERAKILEQENNSGDGNKQSNSDRSLPTCLNDLSHLGYACKDNKSSTGKKESQKHRRSVKSMPFADLARTIASRWKKLDSVTRSLFEERAVLEKERYFREISQWKSKQEKKTDPLHPNVFNTTKESAGSTIPGSESSRVQLEEATSGLVRSKPNELTDALRSTTTIPHSAETTKQHSTNYPANVTSVIPRNVSTNSTMTYYNSDKSSTRSATVPLGNNKNMNCVHGNKHSAAKNSFRSVENTSSNMLSSSSCSYSSQTSTLVAGTSSSTKVVPRPITELREQHYAQYSPCGGDVSPPQQKANKRTDNDSSVSTLSTDGYTADDRPSALQGARLLNPHCDDMKNYCATVTATDTVSAAAAHSTNCHGPSNMSSIELLSSYRRVMHQMLAYHAQEMRRISGQLRQLESVVPANFATLTGNSCSIAQMINTGIPYRSHEHLQFPSQFGVPSRGAGVSENPQCRCCISSNFNTASVMPSNNKQCTTPHWPQSESRWNHSLTSPPLGILCTDHHHQHQNQFYDHGIDAAAAHSQQSHRAQLITSAVSTHLPTTQQLTFISPNTSTDHQNPIYLGGCGGLPLLPTNNTTTPHQNHPNDSVETPHSSVMTEEDIAALEKHFKCDFPGQDDWAI
jgi:hypothetical protein